jgi:hypothetical protein
VSHRRSTPAGSLFANLAAAPFVNRRPVQRFTRAAWVLGILLAALNTLLWLQYRHDSTALRARLAETRSAIEIKSRSVVDADQKLRGLGLAVQNAQVDFLNRRIAERTFPWSLLFERIASTLPDGVRLISLTPVFRDRAEPGAGKAAKPEPAPREELVDLKIRGVAKSDQDLYELIDAFFSSPAFLRPRLYQESQSEGEVSFTVDVQYRPRFEVEAASPRAETEEADDPESTAPPPQGLDRPEAVAAAGDEVGG